MVLLQWGRDQWIAELDKWLDGVASKGALQWGRDQWIAELSTITTPEWKVTLLQWGRDQWIAEFCQYGPWLSWLVLASMGPRSMDRGITDHGGAGKGERNSFNGAAINGSRN